MKKTSFFHVCADGADAKCFIICEEDYRAAFNLIAICAHNSGIVVVAFSLEDTHPHFLLYGTKEKCYCFIDLFQASYKRYVAMSRGSLESMVLDCQVIEISSEEHLMNVGTYIVNQATKDGKPIMPFDYRWSSGPLYFRSKDTIPVWHVANGRQLLPIEVGALSVRERRRLFHSKMEIPEEWEVCDGLIMPYNYVDVKRFEQIYRTHNCYRAFLSSGKNRADVVVMAMANNRGVFLDDLELKKLSSETCNALFGTRDIRRLDVESRLRLALDLRKSFRISVRQIAMAVKLPVAEIEKYL